jgi:RNA polymerase sigma-70 factor (ECF subfamily)
MHEEHYLLTELCQGNKEAFSLLFRKYYKDMVLFGGNFLYDKTRCEDIVQTIFTQLWENRETLVIETSLKSFLLQSVRNGCIDELRHNKSIKEHEIYTEAFGPLGDMDTENYILYSDLQTHLDDALDKLPETYRQAFVMNRFDGLKYKEIAQKLEVSERTVEVRIGKAIGLLRHYLKDFLILILVLLSLNNL